MASYTSKLFLLASFAATGGIIYFVHKSQSDDRAALHQGIVRDLERQHMRKIENLKRLQELEAAYRRRTEVSDNSPNKS